MTGLRACRPGAALLLAVAVLLAGCATAGATANGDADAGDASAGAAAAAGAVAASTAGGPQSTDVATGTRTATVTSSRSAGPGAAGPSAAGAARAVVPALPAVTQTLGAAGCRRLPAATASRLLTAAVRAAADRRLVDGRRTQLDGCVYTTAAGARLSYVLWQLPRQVTAADTAATLPPPGSGARRFDTALPLGAATVLDAGGSAAVQVQAGRGRLLVEVNAVTGTAASARSAALGAAEVLLR